MQKFERKIHELEGCLIPLYEGIEKYLKKPSVNFIGRHILSKNIVDSFIKCVDSRGCFLVGGYRGVGKTLLVERCVMQTKKELNSQNVGLVSADINLGIDGGLSNTDILSDISETLNYQILQVTRELNNNLGTILLFLVLLLMLVSLSPSHHLLTLSSGSLASLKEFFIWNNMSWGVNLVIPTLSEFLIPGGLLLSIYFLHLIATRNIRKVSQALTKLTEGIRYSKRMNTSAQASHQYFIKLRSTHLEREPYSARRIEMLLKEIISELSERYYPLTNTFHDVSRIQSVLSTYFPKFYKGKFKILLIFDELDKVTGVSMSSGEGPTKIRKQKIDGMLGGMKGFVTTANTIVVMIAGRDMVDAYHSESGNTGALYEGLFNEVFYVPTLLTDSSDNRPLKLESQIALYAMNLVTGKTNETEAIGNNYINDSFKSLILKTKRIGKVNLKTSSVLCEEDQLLLENTRYIFQLFILSLTLHSWGNSKRLSSLIRQYIEKVERVEVLSGEKNYLLLGESKGDYYLKFSKKNILSFFQSAQLYSHLETTLGSNIAATDDKLVVSTIITLLDISRFHPVGFSRQHLDRTVERIDIHSEPHLPTVTDQLLTQTLYPWIRQLSSAAFSYRFFSLHEEEFRHVSKSVGARASVFEFSLDAADPIKKHFGRELKKLYELEDITKSSYQGIAHIEIILGDLAFWERSFDESFIHYSSAIQMFKRILRNPDNEIWRNDQASSFSSHYMLIKTLQKKALSEEMRGNRELAERFYIEAKRLSSISFSFQGSGESNIAHRDAPYDWPLDIVLKSLTFDYAGSQKSGLPRHLEVFIRSTLAVEFNALKSGEPLRKEILEFETKWNPRVSSNLYLKVVLILFYSGRHKQISKLLRRLNDSVSPLNINRSKDSKDSKDILIDRKEVEIIRIVSSLNEILRISEKLFKKLKRVKNIDESCIKWLHFLAALKCKLNGDELAKYKFHQNSKGFMRYGDQVFTEFEKINLATKKLSALGFYARSVQYQTAVIGVIIALYEAFPWSRLAEISETSKEVKDLCNIFTNQEWMLKNYKWCESNVQISNSFCFYKERVKRDEFYASCPNELSSLLYSLKQTGKPEDHNIAFKKQLFWHRGAEDKLLVMMCLWAHHGELKIANSLKSSDVRMNFDALIPPIETIPRISSTYWWLYARQSLDLLRVELKRIESKQQVLATLKSKEEVEEARRLTAKCVRYFSKAVSLSTDNSQSEDSNSFPPTAFIYYNVYEFQSLVKDSPYVNSRDVKNFIAKWYPTEKISSFLFNEDRVKTFLKRALKDLDAQRNINSNSFKQKIRHKYFLFDDFQDPVFLIDWVMVRIFSMSADLVYDEMFPIEKKELPQV